MLVISHFSENNVSDSHVSDSDANDSLVSDSHIVIIVFVIVILVIFMLCYVWDSKGSEIVIIMIVMLLIFMFDIVMLLVAALSGSFTIEGYWLRACTATISPREMPLMHQLPALDGGLYTFLTCCVRK